MIDDIVHARRRRWKHRQAASRHVRADGSRLVAQILLPEQLWNDCSGHFRSRLVDASNGGATSDAIVHKPLSPAFSAG
jgi:hypothetical protein